MFHFHVSPSDFFSLERNPNESEKALQSIRHVTEGFYVVTSCRKCKEKKVSPKEINKRFVLIESLAGVDESPSERNQAMR